MISPLVSQQEQSHHVRDLLQIQDSIQGFTKRWALGCEKFLPGPAWLLLSKTGPPFSASMYVPTSDRHCAPNLMLISDYIF